MQTVDLQSDDVKYSFGYSPIIASILLLVFSVKPKRKTTDVMIRICKQRNSTDSAANRTEHKC